MTTYLYLSTSEVVFYWVIEFFLLQEKESVADPGSPNRDQHLRNAGRKNIGITILSQMVAGLWSPTRCQTVLEQTNAEQQKLKPVQWDLFVGMGGNSRKMSKLSVVVAEKETCGAKTLLPFFQLYQIELFLLCLDFCCINAVVLLLIPDVSEIWNAVSDHIAILS